jgi:hypothetical protein
MVDKACVNSVSLRKYHSWLIRPVLCHCGQWGNKKFLKLWLWLEKVTVVYFRIMEKEEILTNVQLGNNNLEMLVQMGIQYWSTFVDKGVTFGKITLQAPYSAGLSFCLPGCSHETADLVVCFDYKSRGMYFELHELTCFTEPSQWQPPWWSTCG